MPLSEFEIIKKHFNQSRLSRIDTSLSIGDDAAIINLLPGHHVVSRLTQWIEGNDYSKQDPGFETGENLILHALQDFNQLSTTANWMTLSISLQDSCDAWLAKFSQGLFFAAKKADIQLIGGDTSRGPDALRIHLIGSQKNI